MTHVDKSSVTREVRGLGFGDMVVIIKPEGAYMREKGKRKLFGPLSWDFLYRRAVDAEVMRAAAEKPVRKRKVSRSLIRGR